MNPLDPLFAVGMTKLAFMQEILVQNYKDSNTRIFVYKYLHFLMLRIFACMCIRLFVAYTKSFMINPCLEEFIGFNHCFYSKEIIENNL
jgi:hypothetical protein